MALTFPNIAHAPYPTTERQLVRAIRRGDDRAFEQLFERYRRQIGAYVYGLIGDHGRAEDITQEVFLSALRTLRRTDGPLAVRPWLYEIARNACIDEYRRSRRATLVSFDESESTPESSALPLRDDETPERRWERKQQIGHLTDAFSGLSPRHHRVLVLRELEGLSYAQIAERLDMSPATVESTLFRARRRLAEEYRELSSGERCLAVRAAIDSHPQRPLATLGVRERRRIGRHLDRCHACLHYAHAAGIDTGVLRRPVLPEPIAALAPLGWLVHLWRKGPRPLHGTVAVRRMSVLGHGGGSTLAAGRVAAAAATLLVAGGVPVISSLEQPAGASASSAVAPGPVGLADGPPEFLSRPLGLPHQVSGGGAGRGVPAGMLGGGSSASSPVAGTGTPVARTGGLGGAPGGPAGAGGSGAASLNGAVAGSGPSGAGASSTTASGWSKERAWDRTRTAVGGVTSTVGGVVAGTGATVTHVVGQAGGTVKRTVGAAGATVTHAVGTTTSTVQKRAHHIINQAGGNLGGVVPPALKSVPPGLKKVPGLQKPNVPPRVKSVPPGLQKVPPGLQKQNVAPGLSVSGRGHHGLAGLASRSAKRGHR